MKMQCTSFTDM